MGRYIEKQDQLWATILAKNGAARLAAALRAPILPVVALKDADASGRLFFSEPIIPPRSQAF